MNEAEEQVWTTTQTGEAEIQHCTDFFFRNRASIFETLFDISVAILFWIKLGSVRRQFFNQDFRVLLKIGFRHLAPIRSGSVPNENDLSRNLPLNVGQGLEQVFTFDGGFKMSFVDLARKSECDYAGQCSTFLGDSAMDRTLAETGPRGRQLLLKGKAKLIPKYDFCAEPLRLFLSLANLLQARPRPIPFPVRSLGARAFAG